MMNTKPLLTILLLCVNMLSAWSQDKPVIDTTAIFSWPTVNSGKISPSGEYAGYIIDNQPRKNSTLVVRSLSGTWEKSVIGVSSYDLTDGNVLVYQSQNVLTILDLDNGKKAEIPKVARYKIQANLLYYLQTDGLLAIQSLTSSKKTTFSGILSYLTLPNGALLLTKANGLFWASLQPKMEKIIYAGNTENIISGATGKQIAFITTEKNGKAIRYYQQGMDSTILLAHGIQQDSLSISGLQQFSADGQRLYISLTEPPLPKPSPNAVMVDIWHYKDAKIQSQQLKELGPKSYLAVLNILSKRMIRLQEQNEDVIYVRSRTSEDFFVKNIKGFDEEQNWNPDGKATRYLIDKESGIKKMIKIIPLIKLADDNIYIGRDTNFKALLAYDVPSDKYFNLTDKVSRSIYSKNKEITFTILATMSSRNCIIISDGYDLWQIHAMGVIPPVCLTSGYGRKQNIAFNLVKINQSDGIQNINQVELLSVFNKQTKESGFYQLKDGKLVTLNMGAFVYQEKITQAKNKSIYLVERESSTEARNYFTSTDFKKFSPISDLHPELKYNWLQTELINFKTKTGDQLQGVIYKPENFDSSKKYPCIIHYYEKKSDNINHFIKPDFITNEINIAWFVSHGYIVCTPDIKYKTGFPGLSALNSIEAATKYLINLPFIDKSHIGLMGHSFGGFETNYVVTHSVFHYAAAASFSGVSDLISSYGSISLSSGKPKLSFVENGQYRMRSSLWQNRASYLNNSPVIFADKVIVPLLFMNNKLDNRVSFEQGIEFFIALRRLNKVAYLLQYDKEAHSVIHKDSQIDLTIRTDQFFNHYLKKVIAPNWMVNGINATSKGIDKGY